MTANAYREFATLEVVASSEMKRIGVDEDGTGLFLRARLSLTSPVISRERRTESRCDSVGEGSAIHAQQ
jgi:hypothetical protein